VGLDLTLVPVRDTNIFNPQSWPGEILAYDRLALDRERPLVAAIRDLPSTRVPSYIDFRWYGQEGLRGAITCANGAELTVVRAGAIASLDYPSEDATDWNGAVLALVRSLPPMTWIVLWWH